MLYGQQLKKAASLLLLLLLAAFGIDEVAVNLNADAL